MRALGFIAFLAGCGGDDVLRYDTDVEPVFEANSCFACHAPGGQAESLDLKTGGWKAIVGVPSAGCEGMNLVEPGHHLESYLWHKLNGTQSIPGGSGPNMPLGGTMDPEDMLIITTWIDEGAAGPEDE